MTEQNPSDVLVTMGEAARQFGTSTKTLKRMLREHGITGQRLNTNVRVYQSDLDRMKEKTKFTF